MSLTWSPHGQYGRSVRLIREPTPEPPASQRTKPESPTSRQSSRSRVHPCRRRGRDDSEKLDQFLLRRYHLYGDRAARDELITMYLPLVRSLARRYASRGEHFDDLVQVGSIGLIKAIDRFDLSRGVELTTYATPNIIGEIKRYFRDKGWSVRVPRGLQELNIRLNKVVDELVPKLQRSPTINEIAEAAGGDARRGPRGPRDEPGVQLGVPAGVAQRRGRRRRDRVSSTTFRAPMKGFETTEDRTMLAPGFARLDNRERYILHLRFFEGLTQSQIASSRRDLADARLAAHPARSREAAREHRRRRALSARVASVTPSKQPRSV